MNSFSHKQPLTIGIDIGRVLIGQDTDHPHLFFEEDYLSAPALPGAFDTIERWVQQFGARRLHLVSKCSPRIQQRSLKWLAHHQFFEQTGLLPTQVHFCLERAQKREICLREHIEVFIDDRYTVLTHLLDLRQLFLFQPSHTEWLAYQAAGKPNIIKPVSDWGDLAGHPLFNASA